MLRVDYGNSRVNLAQGLFFVATEGTDHYIRQVFAIIGREATETNTNDLHEALLNKEGNAFWKCWKSKFGQSNQAPRQVDGIADPSSIAEYFAGHFSRVFDDASGLESDRLRCIYDETRSKYCGRPVTADYVIDAALVECVINKLHRGKAAGLDEITAEHLKHSHRLLPVVLSKLFN